MAIQTGIAPNPVTDAATAQVAVLSALNASLELATIRLPPPEAGQVQVRVRCSGICGKQLDEMFGQRGPDPYLPHMLGHEGAGVVERVGPGVRKVQPGDEVVLHWMKGSGLDAAPPRLSRDGAPLNAGPITTFGTRTIVAENRVTPVPKGTDPEVAALLGCAATTGLGIVFNDAAVRPGQSLAVFGAGGLGLCVLRAATLVNADPVVALDKADGRLVRAKEFGATHTLNTTASDPLRALMDLTDGRGFDAVVDTTGNARIRELAYRTTSATGTTVFAGVPHHSESITIDSFPLHFGRKLVGSHGGNTRPDTDIPRYLRLHRTGRLKLEDLITHRFPLSAVNEAIDLMRTGDAGRVLLHMEPR